MAKIKTPDLLPDEALDELEAALNADFLALPDRAGDVGEALVMTEAAGHIEPETLTADRMDIDLALTEFDRQIQEATGALQAAGDAGVNGSAPLISPVPTSPIADALSAEVPILATGAAAGAAAASLA
ncbi:MAG: hypothetical protein H7Y08_01210, partial [Rhizobiaceae bacterium]|nr:hypothetical protein [Rhizobiaceae bacterium]